MSSPPNSALEHFDTTAASYEASTGGCTRELAQYVVDISPPLESGATILDNACGTCIVAQEILRKSPASTKLTIHCVDASSTMIELARKTWCTIPDSVTVSFGVMSGESLAFPDEHFTHSITNLGILFFSDPSKGAQEIYRTLKPGGTAIVTSWAHLGYLELINEAQRAVNPNNELYRVPIPREWYQGAPEGLLEKTLRDGGFHDVKVHEKRVYYAAKSVGDVCDLLMERMEQSSQGWKGQENEDLRQQLKSNIEKAAVPIERLASGGLDGAVEALVGIPMTALVAVARR